MIVSTSFDNGTLFPALSKTAGIPSIYSQRVSVSVFKTNPAQAMCTPNHDNFLVLGASIMGAVPSSMVRVVLSGNDSAAQRMSKCL